VHKLARRLCHHGISSSSKSMFIYRVYLKGFWGAELSWDSAPDVLFPSWRGRGTEMSLAYLCRADIVEVEIVKSC
jgi:hypothetical protein